MIRAAGIDDVATLAKLHASSFERPWSAIDFGGLLSRPRTFALIAELDGRAMGFALAWALDDDAELLTIAVDPAMRRAGLGRALVEGVCAGVLALGAKGLMLEVDETNAAALALYGGLGFEQMARRKGYYATPNGARDALVLRRPLMDS